MRKTNDNIKDFLNIKIKTTPNIWRCSSGTNFGVPLQKLIKDYFIYHKDKWMIEEVISNENPNSNEPDIKIIYQNGTSKKYEVKSCKNGNLSGVTICNSPNLLTDTDTFLINYSQNLSGNIIEIIDVYETQLHRLTSINSSGKYKGCLISTRDTGKKIKGRNFNDFISTKDEEDFSLEALKSESLIRKTILYYSASKLVDSTYNFTDNEILTAIHELKKH